MLCEIGFVLFLASVGLKAGGKFNPTLISGDGSIRMAHGAVIIIVPIFIAGLVAKIVLKCNFYEVCGLLAGSITDPPALLLPTALYSKKSWLWRMLQSTRW
jgi:putative transport protein